MSKQQFEVYALVRYLVTAETEAEAVKRIEEDSEYPVVPWDETAYYDDTVDMAVGPKDRIGVHLTAVQYPVIEFAEEGA